ncbi:tRNA dihydrouridine(20/20a) synthase DusA [Halopseudomonas phragmitis]|uniref:tRNA-dihydrouridine(20/20a) synthase n=2 Tax=Pseudomonadaceae TaxID=135621 RepID=A0A1V0B5Z9_9GAMM|nr:MULTISPECIES: tRNA dihydrouridine(20/20a) synthase DusA [Pseudomonadaceae]AQZ95362.1 tRNA dihydrouridine(20/20a) synthase DusA [Halopseudomonas phragmitis]RHW20115.1 tRNA dihydrouridine(20/20a) synthase DusA [Pseudomonas jilinensis]
MSLQPPTLHRPGPSRRFCVAPMMDWTDRHCRFFLRLISRQALLYSEMVTTGAVIHGDRTRFLGHSPQEQPLALQLGGSNPAELATCAALAEQAGYAEVNLNVGCPSDRVQNNMIGACLMGHPALVADCVKAMLEACSIPVTVKHRIGINGRDSYDELCDFVGQVHEAGCDTFIVHARIAILEGLSPKENREIPPLRYEVVRQLKADFPQLEIILNGGLASLDQMQAQLDCLDGVMVGREAYHNPYLLAEVDRRFYADEQPVRSRIEVLEALRPYIVAHLEQGGLMNHVTRHILGLFQGLPGARHFRRQLSSEIHRCEDPLALYDELLSDMTRRMQPRDCPV